jgi:hypothetical protein
VLQANVHKGACGFALDRQQGQIGVLQELHPVRYRTEVSTRCTPQALRAPTLCCATVCPKAARTFLWNCLVMSMYACLVLGLRTAHTVWGDIGTLYSRSGVI